MNNYSVLKNLKTEPATQEKLGLNAFYDAAAGALVEHGKRRKLILPSEEAFAKEHLCKNILKTEWFAKSNFLGHYYWNKQTATLSPDYMDVVCQDAKTVDSKLLTEATATGIHESHHALQCDEGKEASPRMKYFTTGQQFGEATANMAELMILQSMLNSNEHMSIQSAELICDRESLENNCSANETLELNSTLLLCGKNGHAWDLPLSYDEYWPVVFRLAKTLDMSLTDIIRSITIFAPEHADTIITKYNKKFPFQSFDKLLYSMSFKPNVAAVYQKHLAPLTASDYKAYINEINGDIPKKDSNSRSL